MDRPFNRVMVLVRIRFEFQDWWIIIQKTSNVTLIYFLGKKHKNAVVFVLIFVEKINIHKLYGQKYRATPLKLSFVFSHITTRV